MAGEARLRDIIKNDEWLNNTVFINFSPLQIENTLNIFYTHFSKWVKKCERNVKNKGQVTPWWSEELRVTRLRVNAHRRRYQRCYNSEIRLIYKRQYYDFKNIYKDIILSAKINSWRNFCFETTKKSLFSVPYKLAFNKIKSPVIIPPIKKPDQSCTTSHYNSIEYILETLFKQDDMSSDSVLLTNIRNTMNSPALGPIDNYFTNQEVNTIITSLRSRTAPGLDNLTVPLIKHLWTYQQEFILSLFNSCLNTGYFPKIWKIGKIILINKPGRPPDTVTAYRPICLNSLLGKVLERLLYGRLYFFLHKFKLLHPNQFGFTHNKSSALALYHLTQRLQNTKKQSKVSLLISLDFSGAFDSVCYPFVLNFLQSHNCPSSLYLLIQSFFKDRQVCYVTAESQEIYKSVSLGCPQGSPLSPLLRNILITDLLSFNFPSYVHIQAFADDVILVIKGMSRRELEYHSTTVLNLIGDWARERKLLLNYSKCFCLLIAPGKRYKKRYPTILFNQHSLKFKSELKLLGVVFDTHLSFLNHANYLKSKVLQHTINLSRFSSIQWGLNSNQLPKIYLNSIEQYIVYAAPVWWKTERNSHLMRRILSVQRLPLLKICKAFHTAPNASLPVLCNILPINITLNIEVFMFKLFQLKDDAQFYEWRISPNNIYYPINLWNVHPS